VCFLFFLFFFLMQMPVLFGQGVRLCAFTCKQNWTSNDGVNVPVVAMSPAPAPAPVSTSTAPSPGGMFIKYFSLCSVYVQCKSFAKLTLYRTIAGDYYLPSLYTRGRIRDRTFTWWGGGRGRRGDAWGDDGGYDGGHTGRGLLD
jgi:hypothetical protein